MLLDPYTARHSGELALGVVGFRPVSEAESSVGYSLAVGEGLATLRGAFFAGGRWDHELRLVPAEALTLGLSRYQWEGGLRLGPIEPTARVGFTLLGLDISRDAFSFGMLSPRAGAGVWVNLATTRIGVSVFTEYWWRWLGDESAHVRGLTLELQPLLEPLRKKNRNGRTAR